MRRTGHEPRETALILLRFTRTLNQRVAGSSPATPTNKINYLAEGSLFEAALKKFGVGIYPGTTDMPAVATPCLPFDPLLLTRECR
jgi:hypothetical protein